MVWAVVEISCAPHGDARYSVPTTFRFCKFFASQAAAHREFEQDLLFEAEAEYAGQNVYYVLMNTAEPLNLDRTVVQDNSINNCGSWLPDSERVYGDVTDGALELVPSEKLKKRAKERANAARAAGETGPAVMCDDEDSVPRSRARNRPGYLGGSSVGATWKKRM